MLKSIIGILYPHLPSFLLFKLNKVTIRTYSVRGPFFILKQKGGICVIGDKFASNSGSFSIDASTCSKIWVYSSGKLVIGNNVGIASTSITCYKSITIGDNVAIGAGCLITDTDHHSTNYLVRRSMNDVPSSKDIFIGSDVFIGARSIILKGVSIGDRSIIAAGSVVVKDIPSDELWGGNPARFLKKL